MVDSTGDEKTIIDPAVEGNEVDTSACADGKDCFTKDGCASTNCQTQEVFCCTDDSCYLGAGYECNCYGCLDGCNSACWRRADALALGRPNRPPIFRGGRSSRSSPSDRTPVPPKYATTDDR
jgi:hypothetical protein